MSEKAQWLDGYYPPSMEAYESFEEWAGCWSMGPHAEADWVWFSGDYYTEAQAKKILAEATDADRRGEE